MQYYLIPHWLSTSSKTDHFVHLALFFIVSRTLLSLYYQVKLTCYRGRRLTSSISGKIKQLNKTLTAYSS